MGILDAAVADEITAQDMSVRVRTRTVCASGIVVTVASWPRFVYAVVTNNKKKTPALSIDLVHHKSG